MLLYKDILSKTNNCNSVCNVISSSISAGVLSCQISKLCSYKFHSSYHHFILFVFTILICQFTVNSTSSSNSSTLQEVSNSSFQNPSNSNWIYQQTKPVPPRLIVGFKLESDAKSITNNGVSYTVKAGSEVTIRIFAIDFGNASEFSIGFTDEPPGEEGDVECHVRIHKPTATIATVLNKHTAKATIHLSADLDDLPYFLCYSLSTNSSNINYFYASLTGENWFKIHAEEPFVPFWLQLVLLCLLLAMSGLFSGLNLGLMALDKNELQVIENCGTDEEKLWSRSIAPVRAKGNYLLCTLLLGNVLVNSTLTIFMDELASGVFAIIFSTLAIVIFGEIIPQSLCSRHGLAVGAKTIYITYLFMALTFPLSFPISLILDKILGEEIGNGYDRKKLMEYIRITKDYNRLEADEMDIISGALCFKDIKVSNIMTPIDDVFMLPYTTTLNFDTLTLINNSGYSRIPIYENQRNNVVGILHVKDLSLIDTDHNLPLKVVLDFYSHPLFSVFEHVTLDVMLNEFKKGKSHMALVCGIITNTTSDSAYELLGVLSLEDVIEELIQAEINDETDVLSDNHQKRKRKEVQSRPTHINYIRHGFNNEPTHLALCDHLAISPQVALATSRFLTSSVKPFNSKYLSEEVLKILMSKNIYFEAKGESRKSSLCEMSSDSVLYIRDQPADYFIMILEGRARVIVTSENQEYDAGPFCFFGVEYLLSLTSIDNAMLEDQGIQSDNESDSIIPVNESSTFTPDFTLFCLEKVTYMKVTGELYSRAIRTTKIDKQRNDNSGNDVTQEKSNSKTSLLLG